MERLPLAGVFIASAVSVASAGPTRKVAIETSPRGATVYVDSVENGPACDATPCTIDAPIGESSLIIQLAGHQPEFVGLAVSKRGRVAPISVKLKRATGTLAISAPRGARVEVDGVDRGTGSLTLEVPAAPVRVVVKQAGKTLYDDFVEVDVGELRDLSLGGDGGATATGPSQGARGDDRQTSDARGGRRDGDGSGDDSDAPEPDDGADGSEEDRDLASRRPRTSTAELGSADESTDGGELAESATAAPRQPLFEIGLAFDVGFRTFAYSGDARTFDNRGEVVVGPALEVWPGRLLAIEALRGLSLFARVQFSPIHQKVTSKADGSAVGAETFWGALELSARHRWRFGPVAAELSGGFVRDQVEFSAPSQTVLMQVPSADYKSIRIGGRLSWIGAFEPFVSAENRFVLSGGELAERATASDTSGYRVAAGVSTAFGKLGARLEASLSRYAWTFAAGGATPPPATSASDSIYWLGLIAGYRY